MCRPRMLIACVVLACLLAVPLHADAPWSPPPPPPGVEKHMRRAQPWYAKVVNFVLQLFQTPPGKQPFADPFSDACNDPLCMPRRALPPRPNRDE